MTCCDGCEGSGETEEECSDCGGDGVDCHYCQRGECETCGGSGVVYDSCGECGGTGEIRSEDAED